MEENLLKYILARVKRTLLLPFTRSIYSIKKLSNIKVLVSKALVKLSTGWKTFFSLKPEKVSDYYYVGRLGIYKKLIALLILFLCLAPVLYFEFFAKSAPVSAEPVPYQEFAYYDPDLEGFSGTASILSDEGALVYYGAVERGTATGFGQLYDLSGVLVYSGDFLENQYHGQGTLYYPSGTRQYQGQWEANAYQGQGSLYLSSGALLYAGQFQRGLMDGLGKLYHDQGKRLLYEGSFREGLYEGEGTLYDQEEQLLYTGAFGKGRYHGQGTLFQPETGRTIYAGQFAEGQYSGPGTLHTASGRPGFTGLFLQNQVDYLYFMGMPTADLSRHFLTGSSLQTLDELAVLSYPEQQVHFMLPPESLTEQVQPVVASILVYDGTLPAGFQAEQPPVYEGSTTLLPQDYLALKALADDSRLEGSARLLALAALADTLLSESTPSGASDQSATGDTAEGESAVHASPGPLSQPSPLAFALDQAPELYLLRYEQNGYFLNLFYEEQDGRLLYYTWE